MKINALAPWYGSNRILGEHVGKLLAGCEWVGVPFAGGMCELVHLDARTILVSDLHRHVINLASEVKKNREALQEQLDALPFHPDALKEAQEVCRIAENDFRPPEYSLGISEQFGFYWAVAYFACSWMARSGAAGTGKEFDAALATRWNAGGGDSAVRFRNATEALTDWQRIMMRCTFVCQDVFDFLDNVHDQPKHGLYLDPPFPGPGDKYKHKFTEAQHRRLAARLAGFAACKVVCRFYEHPLIEELYPESLWAWHRLTGRKQTNNEAPELLLVKN